MSNHRESFKNEPYSIPRTFSHERQLASPGELIVKATCLKCGQHFICDLDNEVLIQKENEHIAACQSRINEVPKRA
jgi:hypothetical protein